MKEPDDHQIEIHEQTNDNNIDIIDKNDVVNTTVMDRDSIPVNVLKEYSSQESMHSSPCTPNINDTNNDEIGNSERSTTILAEDIVFSLFDIYIPGLAVIVLIMLTIAATTLGFGMGLNGFRTSVTFVNESYAIDLNIFESISTAHHSRAFVSSFFLATCSVAGPIICLIALLFVYFGKIAVRIRARILRWITRLAMVTLFYYYYTLYIIGLTSWMYASAESSSDSISVEGLPGCFIFLAGVLFLLAVSQWLYVLHYDASNIPLTPSKKGVTYVYHANEFCKRMCCVSMVRPAWIRARERLDSMELKKAESNVKQGWQFAKIERKPKPEVKKQKKNKSKIKGCNFPTTLLSDMEFVRGSYKYSCSTVGWVGVFVWVVIMIIFETLSLSWPIVNVNIVFYANQTYTFEDSFSLLFFANPTFENGQAGSVIFGFYMLLIVVLPYVLVVLITIALFFPLVRIADLAIQILCHVCNSLSCFQSYEIAVLAMIAVIVDGGKLMVGLLNITTGIEVDPNNYNCVAQADYIFYYCFDFTPGLGLAFAIIFSVLYFPYVYYFEEIYHRHYGLVADGRNMQSYKSGESTFKHRTEGVVVHVGWMMSCCSRKEMLFKQERVDENGYYQTEDDPASVRFPSEIIQRYVVTNDKTTNMEVSMIRKTEGVREHLTKTAVCIDRFGTRCEFKDLPFHYLAMVFVTPKTYQLDSLLRAVETIRKDTSVEDKNFEFVVCVVGSDSKHFKNIVDRFTLSYVEYSERDDAGALCTSWKLRELPSLVLFDRRADAFYTMNLSLFEVSDLSVVFALPELDPQSLPSCLESSAAIPRKVTIRELDGLL